MKLPKYSMVEKEDVDYYGFKIQEGEYSDVIYYYGEVSITEDEENDEASLKFMFNVDSGNEQYTKEDLNDSVDFKTLIGDILVDILDSTND